MDHLQLMQGLDVETADPLPESQLDLGIRFADTGEYDVAWRKARLQRPQDLIAAHTIGTEPMLPDRLQDGQVGIGLDGIMDLDPACPRQAGKKGKGFFQQVHVIVVERGGDGPELRDLRIVKHGLPLF